MRVTVDDDVIFSGANILHVGKMGVSEEESPTSILERERLPSNLAKGLHYLFQPYLLTITVAKNSFDWASKIAQIFGGKGGDKISGMHDQLTVPIREMGHSSLDRIQIVVRIGHYADQTLALLYL